MGYKYKGKEREPAPLERPGCGTNAGYTMHIYLKTPTCLPCRAAHAATQRAWKGRPKIRSTCGTYAGYKRHKRAEGEACEWCLKAYAEYMAAYRKARSGVPILAIAPEPRPFDSSKCGSRTGYRKHHRYGEEACDRCKAAHAVYMRGYHATRRAA